MLALDQSRPLVELADDAFEQVQLLSIHKVCLVEDDDISELHLVDQQIHDVSPIPFLGPKIPVLQLFATVIIFHEVEAINDRDQCVQARHTSKFCNTVHVVAKS